MPALNTSHAPITRPWWSTTRLVPDLYIGPSVTHPILSMSAPSFEDIVRKCGGSDADYDFFYEHEHPEPHAGTQPSNQHNIFLQHRQAMETNSQRDFRGMERGLPVCPSRLSMLM